MRKNFKSSKEDGKVMSYLKLSEFEKIGEKLEYYSILEFTKKDLKKINFDCGIEEYNNFLLNDAIDLDKKHISKTFIVLTRKEKIVIGYYTLATDNLKLTPDEKMDTDLDKVSFRSFPAMKLGKLAVNKNIPDEFKMKGYGSFILDLIDSYVWNILKLGVGCRFITVDADIEYRKDTYKFYEKNGFRKNEVFKNSNSLTISMRRDIFHE